MTAEDLKKFCSIEEHRPMLHEPWSRGGFTYATDAAIIVRVPELRDVPQRPGAPEARNIFVEAGNDHHNAVYYPLPALPEPKTRLCDTCAGLRGVRRVSFDLLEPEDYLAPATLPIGVDAVEGVTRCPDCEGSGRVDVLQYIDIGARRFNVRYLALIAELPLVSAALFQTYAPSENWFPMKFLFAESGEGLLMPLRKDEKTDPLVVAVMTEKDWRAAA
jgi:hypothetical protein